MIFLFLMVWYGLVAWRVLQLQVTASPNRFPFCPRNKRGVDLFDNKFFGVLGRARNSTNMYMETPELWDIKWKKIRRLWKNDLFSSKFKFKEYYSKHGFWVGFCCSEFKGWGHFCFSARWCLEKRNLKLQNTNMMHANSTIVAFRCTSNGQEQIKLNHRILKNSHN